MSSLLSNVLFRDREFGVSPNQGISLEFGGIEGKFLLGRELATRGAGADLRPEVNYGS